MTTSGEWSLRNVGKLKAHTIALRGHGTLRLILTATGLQSKVELFQVEVDESGHWTYRSRAMEGLDGTLTETDRLQLTRLYEQVDWDMEVLNMPISADDTTFFELRVDDGGIQRTYQFSEAINHGSWQLRDLIHYLRHNVATGGEPVGRVPDDRGHEIAENWNA